MASIYRHGKRWRAQVYVRGARESDTFDTKAQAVAWANLREAELSGDKIPERTFGQALERYGVEVAPTHRGEKWELLRLKTMGRTPLADKKLADIRAGDITQWRNDRSKTVSAATVLREMKLMASMFETCRKDFGWIRDNPMKDVSRPKSPPSRKRRIEAEEIERLEFAFGLSESLQSETMTQRVGLAFLFALETAMRAGEMLGLRSGDVSLTGRYATLPKTKNGDARQVPLSTRAIEILKALPETDGPLFGLTEPVRDVLWRKIRDKAAVTNLHFHDSRAEAIWRLSKKLDVLQLARVIGHRDLKSLLIYYAESASDIAKRLD